MFSKELDFATLDAENILFKVDARLVTLQYVKAQQNVRGTVSPLSRTALNESANCGGPRTSMIVNEQGKKKSASLSWVLCTRPRISAVPTPRAVPAKRLSMRGMMLEYSRKQDLDSAI